MSEFIFARDISIMNLCERLMKCANFHSVSRLCVSGQHLSTLRLASKRFHSKRSRARKITKQKLKEKKKHHNRPLSSNHTLMMYKIWDKYKMGNKFPKNRRNWMSRPLFQNNGQIRWQWEEKLVVVFKMRSNYTVTIQFKVCGRLKLMVLFFQFESDWCHLFEPTQ